ncbi:uncharacterized protein Chro isoform X2 [Planococcus citri]|uniref:uncharacterized protein Chro isoform X2 n=1 Tax=Planococcus citri TaxID=170843 RepID=UPI0031F96BEA
MPVNTPSEVSDPMAAVTAAENEASSLDILVCGNCQSVFHFVEEFGEHKLKNDCEKADKTSLNSQGNKKPQVWAFLIWKNSQTKVAVDQQGSWKLYQRWCNMPESQRQSWVTAGRNIQAFINLSHARELNKFSQQVDTNNKENEKELDEEIEEDFVVEKIVGKRYNHKKKRVEYLLKWEGYPPEQNTWEPLSNLTTCKSLLQEYERLAAQTASDKSPAARLAGVLKRDIASPATKLSTGPSIKPSGMMPGKYLIEKKVEPTLQTQRKIVPATPLTNSMAATPKTLSPFERYTATTPKFDTNKEIEPKKLITGGDTPSAFASDPSLGTSAKPINIDDDDFSPPPLSMKRTSDGDSDAADDNKRSKLNETSSLNVSKPSDDVQEVPKSGIFKKSEVRDKFPSITTMLGKGEDAQKSDRNSADQRGILKVDHAQMPEIQSGIYKMSVKGASVKIDSVAIDRQISGILPTPPGPKGGVLILGNRLDVSKVSKASPKLIGGSPDKSQSPAFRGVYPRTEIPKVSKPDFQKTFSPIDNVKKPVNSLRKVLGGPIPRGRSKTSLPAPGNVSRLKNSFVKGYGDSSADTSGTRLVDGDGFLMEFCEYENSDMEDYSLPDDFPEELDMEPLSPARPLTLDPETGKRLMRAEGEPTPQPTPEPSPEPSPAPSPVPTHQILLKDEKDMTMTTEGLILKTDDVEGETYTEINGNTYKVTNAAGLLQNAAFATTQDGGELKAIAVPAELADGEHAENTNMITITGEDGLVYQVANAKLEGDTIVVASGEDEQQCVFVTEDGHQVMQRTNEDGSTVLTLESAYADAVSQLVPNQINILPDGSQIYVKQEENGQVELMQIQAGTEIAEQEATEEQEQQIAENADENSGQVVAQLIEAGEPAPGGGPRRVVLLLPDGNLMVTEVDEEQYAALELEK